MQARLVLCGLALAFSAISEAGTVGYRINNGTTQTISVSDTAPYTSITIPVGVISGNTDVQVFTYGSGSSASVGTITIQGTNPSGILFNRVLIAEASVTTVSDAFGEPGILVQPGLKNVGGLTFTPAPGYSTTLRDTTIASVNTLGGDITGTIEAGGLFRVACFRSSGTSPTGGVISGTLRSTSYDGYGTSSSVMSIAYVKAHQITGTLQADGLSSFSATDTSTWGSIGRVVAGPATADPNFVAFSGTINCPNGLVKELLCTGRIGTSETQKATINAGMRIERISMRAEGSSGDANVEDLPIYADIDASDRNLPCAINGRESSLVLLETGGDFVGSLKISDFFGIPGNAGGTPRESDRRGIFVGGKFEGDIDVTYSYQYGDMVARSFRGDITIGQMLKGAIIAVGTQGSTDPLDGTIQSVEVGFSSNLSGAPRPNAPGFNATETVLAPAPFEGEDRDNWYTMDYTDFSTADSIIRADKSIGTVHLKAISNRLPELGGKASRARVESPSIQTLRIEHFDTGTVWSGKVNWNRNTQAVEDDISDDYASIHTVEIGCMGPKADLWVKNTASIDISGDMFGEIHMPELVDGQTIRIAGRFGDTAQAESDLALCGAETSTGFNGYFIQPNEQSPRGVWAGVDGASATYPNGVPDYGRIIIDGIDALEGQIILDAANGTKSFDTSFWHGDVVVGTAGTPKFFSVNAARAAAAERVGPYYTAQASPFGGGAIGLTPFPLARQDCEPYSECTGMFCGSVPVVTESRFVSTGDGIILRFFGPVVLQTGGSIHLYKATAHGVPITTTDYVSQLSLSTSGRELVVHGPNSLDSGRYVIVHTLDDDGLVCDRLFNDEHPVVPAFKYHFVLVTGPISDAECTDFNGDGDVATDADIEAFFACLGGNCCSTCFSADFNCDGDVATDRDIEDFFYAFGSGICPSLCQ